MHSVAHSSAGLQTTRRTTRLSFPASPHQARVPCFSRLATVVRTSERSYENDDKIDSSGSGGHEVARELSSLETADSSTAANNTPQRADPAETPAKPPARQPLREIDVNRAVQLLKVTSQRSSKRLCKLPPWLARTRDPDVWGDPEQPASVAPGSTAAVRGKGNAGSDNSSKHQSSEEAASVSDVSSPLDSYMALREQNNATIDGQRTQDGINDDAARYSSFGSSTSRPSIPTSTTAAAAAGPSALNSRMFNASDPVVRSKGRRLSTRGGFSMLLEGVDTDAAKEQERQFRRAVFSFDRWAAHRSTARYIRHFKGIFSSRTFQGLLQPMSFLTGMAVLCGMYNVYAIPKGAPAIVISSTPLDITAFAVSLLLVFRTDSSYARWKEALQTWNEVRSLSKDLARQACYWVDEPARKAMLVRWCEAFSRALLVHCRVDGNLQHELEDVLLPHEVAAVAAVGPSGAPSFVLQVLAELIEQCPVTETKEGTMFSTVRALSDSVAVCNKLLRYPLPLAYTRHTSRFMFLWLSAMPWAMWSDMHWACVPVTAAISYLLLGIDEIGVQIEEPFGILPLEDVCVDIVAEIDAMMERQDIVTDLLAAGGVDCAPRSMCGECGQPLVSTSSSFGNSSGGDSSSGGGSGSDSHCSSSNINGAKEVTLNGSQPVLGSDSTAAASPAAAQEIAQQRDTGSSSSGVTVSSSASNGAGAISRINKSGSPQGLVARWVSSTISGSVDPASDALSSLEDAVAPGFDLRGFVVRDPEAGDDEQRRLDRRGWSEVSSLESLDVDTSSSSSDGSGSRSISRLGWYQRQPTPTADHKYPD